MRASCSESWAGSVSKALRTWLALGSMCVLSVLQISAASAATKSTAPADTGGFSVRVREEGGTPSTLPPSARRAIERAKEQAQAKAGGIPTPPEPPATPDIDEGDDYVRFGEDITIPEGRTVDGDVVAIGGNVTVLGHVTGDAVSVGGTVQVRGKGIVDGDVVAMGGTVSTSDSGSVGGKNVSLGSFRLRHHDWPTWGHHADGFWAVQAVVRFLLTILFAWIALLLAKERLVYAVDNMYQHFGRSFLWGLAGLGIAIMALPTAIILIILVGAITVAILCITIIGIPVAILLLLAMAMAIVGMILALLASVFLGYLNGAMFLGDRIRGRSAAVASREPLVAIVIGAGLLAALKVSAHLLDLVGISPLAIALGIAAGALVVILTIAGFGAMVMTRFARGPRGEGALGAQWWPPSRPRPVAEAPVAPQPTPAPATPAPPEGGSSDAP